MPPDRVLLVDEDPIFIRRLRRTLDPSVELQVAMTGDDALLTTTTWTPDLVVIDPLLGDSDSFGVLDTLRERLAGSCLGVICLSKGPGSATRFQEAAGTLYGVIKRESAAECIGDALHFVLARGDAQASCA